jgi:glycogen operon protein
MAGPGLKLDPGVPQPPGANWTGRGTNFAVFSQNATRVDLCLFDATGRKEVARIPLPSRTGDIWHGFLPARFAGPGTLYGYRVDGPYSPAEGHRFNPAKLLLDPCTLQVHGDVVWHDALNGALPGNDAAPDPRDSAPYVPKSRIVDTSFDWGGVRAPNVPWRDTVLYELHVKGFTKLHPRVRPELRGTYLGLAEPAVVDYLRRLGVTSVELMPCQAFATEKFLADRGLVNYWGYNPYAWFAPASQYAVEDPVREFKTMVRALHEAGIEVILDVVFNHTAEGNENGPMLNLRGFDNSVYYRLFPHNLAHYKNFSGCGNTTNFDPPPVRGLVLDCLRYWVSEMQVDGFRFDLAPILGRLSLGYDRHAPFFAALRSDPVLSYVKLIAEPWDVGPSGYQLGHFPSGWSEWNDRYRDTMRAFWRGDRPLLGAFAERFAGSSDLFRDRGRKPTASINYLSSHDGFTLYDTVAYNQRHNLANLEGGHDGHPHNLSWNCGVEGPTDDPAVNTLRDCQMRNMFATLLLSQGVPMIQAGDEFARTQRGNNNAYCQDNEISWVDWNLLHENPTLCDFVRRLIDLRRSRLWLRRDTFLKGARGRESTKDVTWLHPAGHELTAQEWANGLRCIGVLMSAGSPKGGDVLAVFNADDHPVEFRLPTAPAGSSWVHVFDTARPIGEPGGIVLRCSETETRPARSTVLLEARPDA